MRIPIRRRAALLATFAALALSAILPASSYVSAALDLPPVTKALSGPEEVVRVDRERRTPEYVDGEIIVKLRPALRLASGAEAATEGFRALNMELGAEIVDSTYVGPDAEVFLVRIPVGTSVDEAVMTYGAQRFVEYAEPNYLWYPETPVIPNDPHFWRLWGMCNTGQDFYPGVFWEKGIPGCDISATEAWGVRTDASSVLVAVIDSGIDVNHLDLTNNIWRNPGEIPDNDIDDDGNGFIDDVYGWDFANDDNTVFDDPAADRHGTHCAGTIGAEGNNGRGVAGVAWTARIMSCKFIHGRSGSTWDAIDAINYASMMGAKIASNSWGGGGESQALKEAIANSGMLFIASAGNSAENTDIYPHYPSSYDCPNIISVAASDWNDNLVSFSCYGPESVDLAAPGHWILSAYAAAGYIWMGGTSMATPHVSGAAALVSAEYPDMPLYPGAAGWIEGDLTVKDALLMSADGNPAFAGRMTSGGRLNVANAVKRQFPVRITSASADVTFGTAPLAVNFSAEVEYPFAVEQAWWSFGDGSHDAAGYTASRTYEEDGAYLACFHAVTSDGVESAWPAQVVVADPGTVILVDDDGGFDFEGYFLYACEQAGLDYVVVDSRYPLGLPDDFSDRMLVWNTSFSWSDTLLPDQEDYLARFLDNGGRLLMISPQYLYDLGVSPFARDYLHVWDHRDNVPMGHWDGIDGDVITDGMSLDGQLGFGKEDTLWPDLNAKPILKCGAYEDGVWPALRYADESQRLVFTTVPWEELPIFYPGEEGDPINPDPNNSAYFLTKIHNYLIGPINRPPTVDKMEADIYFAKVGEEIRFTAQAHDVDGDSITYLWQFGGPGEPIEPVEGDMITMAFDEPGGYEVILTVADEHGECRSEFMVVVVVNPGSVVFVDDDDSNDDTQDYFFAAFDAIGQEYLAVPNIVMTGEYCGLAGLERFLVVWNCGELGGLNELEQATVAEFLGKGGRLFLAGQEVMFGLDKSADGKAFARDYLHVAGVEHDVGTAYVTGVAGDPVTGSAGQIDLVFPWEFDDWTDSLTVAPEAAAIFLNDQDQPCALRYTGDDHRLVFMAVAFEAFPLELPPETYRAAGVGVRNEVPPFGAAGLLGNVIEWIDEPLVTVKSPVADQVCTEPTIIAWETADYTDAEISIDIDYSMDGGSTWHPVATGEANDGSYLWDVTELGESGPCVIRVTASRPDETSGSGMSAQFNVLVNLGVIVFVDDDGSDDDTEGYFIDALDAIGAQYIVAPPASVMGEDGAKPGLELYRVVWNCGEHGGLDELEQAAIADFLDKGGRLFLAGQQIMSELAGAGGVADFARNCLHVTGAELDVGTAYVTGVVGDPVTGGAGQVGLVFPEGFDDLTDALTIAPEATAIFLTDEGKPCALRYTSGKHRLVFMAVAFEAFPLEPTPEAQRAASASMRNGAPPFGAAGLLGNIIEWIDEPLVTVTGPVADQICTEPTIIAWETADYIGAELSIGIDYSMDGGSTWHPVATGEANDGSYLWDVTELSESGPCVIRVTASRSDETSGSGVSARFNVLVNLGVIVFVDDDDSNDDTEGYFVDALDAIGAEHIVAPPASVMGENGAIPGLELYRVVWNCGEHGGLSEMEQAVIADFLDKGGRLFLAGQQIMSGLAGAGGVADFARNCLHVTGAELDVGTTYVTGVVGDPVTGGAGQVDLVFPEGFDDLTDVLTIAPEATPIFLTDKGRPCALRYTSGKHRLVFMAVAFEGLPLGPVPKTEKAAGLANGAPPFDAGALLAGVLGWIDTPIVIVTKPVGGQVYTGSTTVGWTAADYTGMGLAIKIEYSVDDGNTWTTLATNEANDGSYLWDLTKLSRGGQYIVCVTASRPDTVSGSGASKPFIVSVVGANKFVAGPNPASDTVNFYINASGDATLYVYDIAGRQVFSQKIESGQTYFEWHLVNSAGKPLANGLYLCYMVTADGVRTDITRLVISRQSGVME